MQGQALQHTLDTLIEDLSRYMSNSYHVDTFFRAAMRDGSPWPGKHLEEVKLEDLLYNKIRLCLNPNDPLDVQVLSDLEHLRDSESQDLWINRRDQLVESARKAFDGKWKRIGNSARGPEAA